MDVLDGLDPEQREVALATRGAVCVLAGAGTGKTRAITHRIAYAAITGQMDPARVLALTFTVRAAGELRGRLRQLGAGQVRASTFHAAALRQLNYFWPRVIGGRPPALVNSKGPLVREAAQQVRVRVESVADVAAEIEWAKTLQIRPDAYPALAAARIPPSVSAARPSSGPGASSGPSAHPPAASSARPSAGSSARLSAGSGATPLDAVAAVYAEYERLRRERHLIDFESVLELTAAMIYEHRLAADQVRDAFRYFVVDEYQDVNPLQKLLLEAWLGDRDELCVVGDPHQTIYTFTGATPDYLTGFTKEFPDAAVVRLVRDYRSTPQVVALANQVIRAEAPLVAQRKPGPSPLLTEYADEADEAAGVSVQVRALMAGGVPAREIAILVRINAHTERYEQALAEAGVPFVVRGGERFYERPIVKQALVMIRGAARAGAASDAGDGAVPDAVRHVLTGMGFTASSPAAGAGAAGRERWESLAAIAQLADDLYASRPGLTFGEFAAELTQRAELGHAPAVDGVVLASMHAAKGLEWDAVLLPGLVDGVMPIVHARTPGAIEEERRLLYVAVTRAREHLYLSWAPARAIGQRATRPRSRFLDDIRLGGRRG